MLDVAVPDVLEVQIAIGYGKRSSHLRIIMPVSGEGKSVSFPTPCRLLLEVHVGELKELIPIVGGDFVFAGPIVESESVHDRLIQSRHPIGA